ncbi:hypothetical protein BJ742DRAFT_819225 [Cladochytrium replicatum]|nr:hypothetical protein BJ742DRAFT_819225 [Cladochytrium replicatum]
MRSSVSFAAAALACLAAVVSATDYSSNSYGISDWQTCHPGKDSCANSNSKCCIAKADKHSGKYTCRPAGKDCDSSDYYDNTYSGDYYDDSYSGDYYDDSYSGDYYDDSYSGDYYDDSYSGDSYGDTSSTYYEPDSSGYYGARAKGRHVAHAKGASPRHPARARFAKGTRPHAGRSPARHGLTHSNTYDDYYGVADWKTCHPSSETCSNPSAKCCIAKADKSSGKYTCRPHGQDCDSSYDSYGSTYDDSYSSDYYDDSYSSDYYDDSYSSDYYDDSYSGDYYDDSYSGDYYDDSYGSTSSTYEEPSNSGYYGARAKGNRNHARPAGRGIPNARHAGNRANPAGAAPAQNPAGAAPKN